MGQTCTVASDCPAGPCAIATCNNGSCGVMFLPSGSQCAPPSSLGPCDAGSFCTGSSAQCPPDTFSPADVRCAPAQGACDLGSFCTGSSFQCPPDTFQPSTFQCAPAQGPCDLGSFCTGNSPQCVDKFQPSGLQCASPVGVCDLGSFCTGNSPQCGPDTFRPTTFQCEPPQGPCDQGAFCTGSSTHCGPDTFKPSTVQCAPAQGACDLGSFCTGSSPLCGPDTFKPSTVQCAAAQGACDLGSFCTGTSATCGPDTFKPSTAQCAAAQGPCDLGSFCTGTSAACGPDTLQPAGTQCDASLCELCSGTSQTCPGTNLCVCREEGYWGTHAGEEQRNATNQTSNVIASVGSLNICGHDVIPFLGAGNTGVNHQEAPVEALCSNDGAVGGTYQDQLVSALTATALNCAATGHAVDCSNHPLFATAFSACNTPEVCAPTTSGPSGNINAQSACVTVLNCLNSGGHPGTDAAGKFLCATGTCSDNNTALCTASDLSNCAVPTTAMCLPSANCETENFPLYPDSPAGSPKACNAAMKTACTIFGSCLYVP